MQDVHHVSSFWGGRQWWWLLHPECIDGELTHFLPLVTGLVNYGLKSQYMSRVPDMYPRLSSQGLCQSQVRGDNVLMPSSVSIPSCTSWSSKLPAALLIPALGWHLAVFDWLLAVWQGLVLCATAAQANLSICIVLSVFSVHCFVLIFVRENCYGVSEKDVMVLA
jgi:hypothetical protein